MKTFIDIIVPKVDDRLISYDDSEPNFDNEGWIRRRLIDEKEHILFVGESETRALTIALAVMRGCWDNIWASREPDVSWNWAQDNLKDMLSESEKRAERNVNERGELRCAWSILF